MPPRSRAQISVERAARKDLAALREYGGSGLAKTYLLLARQLDEGLPARDAAAAVREMRLIFLALQELSPSKEGDDYTDELRARREKRMQAGGS
jgi:hypothetical protein